MEKSADDAAGQKASPAPALLRGLRILELLATATEPQSLTDIANHLGIAMSSAFSLCKTLRDEGYVTKGSDNSYQLTLKVLDLASSRINKYDIVEHFYEVCDEIPIARSNAAMIAVLDGADVFYIGTRASPHPIGITFKVGMRLPACCTASGRALLANLSEDEVRDLYPDEKLPQITELSLETRTQLFEVLRQVRRQGYATEKGTTRRYMHSYGALVATPAGKAIVGVAISLYEGDLTTELEADAIVAVQILASKLARFGGIMN